MVEGRELSVRPPTRTWRVVMTYKKPKALLGEDQSSYLATPKAFLVEESTLHKVVTVVAFDPAIPCEPLVHEGNPTAAEASHLTHLKVCYSLTKRGGMEEVIERRTLSVYSIKSRDILPCFLPPVWFACGEGEEERRGPACRDVLASLPEHFGHNTRGISSSICSF